MTAVALFFGFSSMSAKDRFVPSKYSTIQSAINASLAGDAIVIDEGTYNEAVSVNKSVTLVGAGLFVIITPPSGSGITISANNVVLQSLRVTGCPSTGIVASTISNLTLVDVSSDNNAASGARFTNVNGVSVTGCIFSHNHDEGFTTAGGSNYTIVNSFADSNGTSSTWSGITLKGITGSSTVTNLTAIGNKRHGLSITASNITITGGTFNSNGVGRGDGTGGGININASGGTVLSAISLTGSITASSNSTAGIWINAGGTTDTIKALSIGSGGVVTLTNNGGAGVILLGNVKNSIVTANFTKGSAFAAGILIVGINFTGSCSPVNTTLKFCTFNSDYQANQPAISLSAGVYPYTSVNPVLADSNLFVGATTPSAIEDLIWHYPDDTADHLGLVTHTHDNTLPVELVSFTAAARGRQIELRWATATETNNYGFELERIPLNPLPSPPLLGEGIKTGGFQKIGFVQGYGTTSAPHAYLYRDEVQSAGKIEYRLKQIDRDGKFKYSASVEVTSTLAPADYGLSQNYPNPFNPSTKIRFALEKTGFAEMKVFDTIGREVQTLFSGFAYSGELQEISFVPEKLAAGVYFYTLSTNNRHEVKKMLLLK